MAADPRIVLTLDAGGTSFVFSAIRAGAEVAGPLTFPAHGDDLPRCLDTLVQGFRELQAASPGPAAAISFAFPGPAHYREGIIGDLGNLPGFRGGVALGPMLEERFGLPTFINNDGDLFACGEAMAGLLPEVNAALAAAGSPKRFRNLLGCTLGTGFGAGIVLDGRLHLGDNGAGAEIWCTPSRLLPDCIAEEAVSIRAVRRSYARLAGLALDAAPVPREIFEIGMDRRAGDGDAAREAFRLLGEAAGDALATAATLLDALVVVGGGLSGAAPLFLPALVSAMNGDLGSLGGGRCPRMEFQAFDLDDPAGRAAFLQGRTRTVDVPGSTRQVSYDELKRTGVGLSRLGTSRAVALGACAFALDQLDHPTPTL